MTADPRPLAQRLADRIAALPDTETAPRSWTWHGSVELEEIQQLLDSILTQPEHAGPNVYGLALTDIPKGWQPVEALVVVKALKPENDECPYGLVARATSGITTWEAEGMAAWLGRVSRGDYGDDSSEG